MEKGVIGIIFISLFILFGSIAFITGIIPEGEEGEGGITCFDTDFGDYGEQGTCQDSIISYEDACTNSNTLREYDCTAANRCGYELKTCDNGCEGGACVASTGCTENLDCTGVQPFCNTAGACVGCLENDHCANVCLDGACVDCQIDNDCGVNSGKICEGNVCVNPPGTGCTSDGECDYASGETCLLFPPTYVSGSCVVSTGTGADCELVSGTDTLIDGSPSIPSFNISAWTAVIPGATWIWNETTVSNPTADTTLVFTKTFDLSSTGGTLGGTLVVAADNSYSCTLNNDMVFEDTNENNFRADTKDTYDLSGKLNVGRNTLVCEVKNWAQAGGTGASNPAGLLYRLSVTGESCVAGTTGPACNETDGGLNYFSPGTVSTEVSNNTDSCSTDGSSLTEYYCADGVINSIPYDCVCIDSTEGGFCVLSGGGMTCEAFNSHNVTGGLVDMEDMEGVVDDEIQGLLVAGDVLTGLTLSRTPVKSKVENPVMGDVYYCGLDLLWHQVKQTVSDISCISDSSLDCGPNTACLEDYECGSNSCVDNYCISISAELEAQRNFLVQIWCVVTNLPSYIAEGDISSEYTDCLAEAFGGV